MKSIYVVACRWKINAQSSEVLTLRKHLISSFKKNVSKVVWVV